MTARALKSMEVTLQAGTVIKLKTPTFGIVAADGNREAVTVPSNAVLTILSHSERDRMVDVCWEQQTLSMFAIDLRERGELAKLAAER